MTVTPSDPTPSDSHPSEAAPQPEAPAAQAQAPADESAAPAEATDVPAGETPPPSGEATPTTSETTSESPAPSGETTAPNGETTAPGGEAGTLVSAPGAGPSDQVPAEPAAHADSGTPAEPDTQDAPAPPAPSSGEAPPASDTGAAPSGDAATPSTTGVEQTQEPKKKPKKKKKKAPGPDPVAVIKTIGTTSDAALAYVQDPDPKLSRMARKHREVIITDIPPVTAGALLGPAALCRHFLASAATGRYRDLFYLWELFTLFPEECKGVLAQRQIAQEKAKKKLRTATHLGLLGDAVRVAEDIDRAAGLPWRWMKEILEPMDPAIRRRPAVMAALARRDDSYQIEVPEDPSDEWLAEAAAMRDGDIPIPEAIDRVLGKHADRLPATVATLTMAQTEYPDRVPALIDRVDLDAEDIGAILAWSRDHGHAEQLTGRIAHRVEVAATDDRAAGLAEWKTWNERGVEIDLPDAVLAPNLDGLDIGRPETADLVKILVDRGADLDPQAILDGVAADNRMRGEKAFENFVCAGFDGVHLPLALEGNPMVRAETRCPGCQAWTWVRPGHETRCPRTEWSPETTVDVDTESAAAAIDAAVAAIDAGADENRVVPDVPPTTSARPSSPPPSGEPVTGPEAAPTTSLVETPVHDPPADMQEVAQPAPDNTAAPATDSAPDGTDGSG